MESPPAPPLSPPRLPARSRFKKQLTAPSSTGIIPGYPAPVVREEAIPRNLLFVDSPLVHW